MKSNEELERNFGSCTRSLRVIVIPSMTTDNFLIGLRKHIAEHAAPENVDSLCMFYFVLLKLGIARKAISIYTMKITLFFKKTI